MRSHFYLTLISALGKNIHNFRVIFNLIFLFSEGNKSSSFPSKEDNKMTLVLCCWLYRLSVTVKWCFATSLANSFYLVSQIWIGLGTKKLGHVLYFLCVWCFFGVLGLFTQVHKIFPWWPCDDVDNPRGASIHCSSFKNSEYQVSIFL